MRFYIGLLVICSISFASSSFANRFCALLTSFASGTDISPELVTQTYKKILEDVGDSKITPEVIAEMIQSGDPYMVPKSAALGSSTLQQSLNDFREILSERSGEKIPFKKELLALLEATGEKQKEQEKKQVVEVKKREGKSFDKLKWEKSPRQVEMFGDWTVAIITNYYDNGWKQANLVQLVHRDGREFSVPYETPFQAVIMSFDSSTGEIWFSDRSKPLKLAKMSIFDEKGVPRKKAEIVEPTWSPEMLEYSCDALEFSPTGKHFLLVDDRKGGLLFDPLKGAAKLGKVATGGMAEHFAFIGGNYVYIQQGRNIQITDVRDPKRVITLPVPDSHSYARMSPDDKTLYVYQDPVGSKTHMLVYDVEALKQNPKTQPKKWDLGHSKELGQMRGPHEDFVFPVADGRALHLLREDTLNTQPLELRLVDVKDPQHPRVLNSVPIANPSPNFFSPVQISADRKFIFGAEQKNSRTYSTWIWNLEAFGLQ